MFSTIIDKVFGGVTGIKTEITTGTMVLLNVANTAAGVAFGVTLPPDLLVTLNTMLGGLLATFVASRLSRIESAATIAATAPVVVAPAQVVESASTPVA